jgi:adenylate cyclase
MFDDTAKIRKQKPTETIQEQVRQLTQGVNEMVELLRSQQEVLRQYGMNLPSGSLDGLRKVRMRVDTLNTQLMGAQSELRQLRGLAETTSLINSSLDTSDVLNQVIDKVVQLTGAERGYIVLKNQVTGAMEFRVARGIDQEQLEAQDFIVSNTIVNRVATTGEPVLTHNAQNDPIYRGQESIVGFALRSILAVPLRVGDDVIGVVYCDNRIRAGLFKEHELNLLKAFSNQAAVAIQNARLFESVRARVAEITEIRDLMDNIFTSIASGLITLNRNNIITAYNTAAERIIGIPTNDALGSPLASVLPMLDSAFAESLEGAREQQVEIDLTFEEPTWRFWKVKLSPLRDASGHSEGVAMVLDDLTDVKQREAQLDAAIRYTPVQRDNLHSLDTSAVGGQERVVSVLFADVRGFTPFSERLEPEALMQIINEYLSRASDAIELYEGVVDKYMGDAVTGLFNTQLNPQQDHALRAVRAAISMSYDIAELHEQLGEDQRLFYGIGVHTGMAVLGSVGSPDRREFSAIGDGIDFSKLLQENALGGEIMLSPDTYELVKDYFDFEEVAPRKTKGRENFTLMYKLTGIKRRTSQTAPLQS